MFGFGGQECIHCFIVLVLVLGTLAARVIVFTGDEFIRFKSDAAPSAVYDQIEDALQVLGNPRISKSGNIDILPRRSLENALTQTTIEGTVREKNGDYSVDLDFSCTLSTLGWVLLVLGTLFFFVGLIVLIAHLLTKNKIAQSARRAIRELE